MFMKSGLAPVDRPESWLLASYFGPISEYLNRASSPTAAVAESNRQRGQGPAL
jgi:hypothetical protein